MSKEEALKALAARMKAQDFASAFAADPSIVEKVAGASQIPDVVAAVKAFHGGAGIQALLKLRDAVDATGASDQLKAQMV